MLSAIPIQAHLQGEGDGAGALVALWNARAFVGEPEPPGPSCPHSNR